MAVTFQCTLGVAFPNSWYDKKYIQTIQLVAKKSEIPIIYSTSCKL